MRYGVDQRLELRLHHWLALLDLSAVDDAVHATRLAATEG
jgi:hypothetical protein